MYYIHFIISVILLYPTFGHVWQFVMSNISSCMTLCYIQRLVMHGICLSNIWSNMTLCYIQHLDMHHSLLYPTFDQWWRFVKSNVFVLCDNLLYPTFGHALHFVISIVCSCVALCCIQRFVLCGILVYPSFDHA